MLGEARHGLVDIVTQVRSHRPLVELSLAAGAPTIVQKPFGLTLAVSPRNFESSPRQIQGR